MTSRDVALTARCSSPTAHAPALPSSTCSLPSKHWIHGFASACTWVSVDNFLPCSSLNPRSSLLLSYPSNISASATTTLCSTDPSSALDPLVLMCRRTHTYTVHCTVASCNTCFKCFKTISTFRKALRSSACLGSLCSARGSFFRLQCKVCSRSAQTQALCLHGAARALRVYNTTDDERRPNCARRGGGTPNRTECVGESEARSDQA